MKHQYHIDTLGVVILIAGVRALKELWKEESPCFGNKANTLSKAMKWGIAILPGFCVTFDLNVDYNSQLRSFSAQIEQFYQKLMEERGNCRAIVRSSVDLEDGENAQFPGIFSSISGVATLPQLYQAIRRCFDSHRNPAVRYYARENAADFQFQYFTVLIQEELQSQYAGLATTRIPVDRYMEENIMLASLTQGNNHELVKGIGPSSTYSFCMAQDRLCVRKITGNIPINQECFDCVFQKLYQVLTSLRQKAGRELEVEWGYAGGELYIFQIRFAPKLFAPNDDWKEQAITGLSGDASQGFKYQAMRFFQEQGLFSRKSLLFPYETSAREVAQAVLKEGLPAPITVRFSKKGEIGLPRAFLPDGAAAAEYICHTKQPDWSVIVYSSLTVRQSFEMYIDHDTIILECVPGMWESGSSLAADMAVLTQGRARFWLVKEARNAQYEDEKGVRTALLPPTSLEQMRTELTPRISTMYRLREIFSSDLPLNFHFVSDGICDYFLNCRRTRRIFWEDQYGGPVQVIETVADCSSWDGKSSILFRPKLHRGEELLLFQFIPFLKRLSVPIYVEFGILSHPAIMLREFEITVIPYFLHHDYYEISLEEI